MVKHSSIVSGRAEEWKEEKPFYKRGWFKAFSYTLAGLVALTGIGYAVSNYLSRNVPAYREPPAVVREYKPQVPTIVQEPTNSYDFAVSLGLKEDYLKELYFDNSAKEFVRMLSSKPYIRQIATGSLLDELLTDKSITPEELSYLKEIDGVKTWLSQVDEKEVMEALAINLKNFREAERKGELFYSLKIGRLPALLNNEIFTVDMEQRKYVSEILNPNDPAKARTGVISASATIKNMTQDFWNTHDKAWYIAHHPDYVTKYFLQRFPNEFKNRSPPSTREVLYNIVGHNNSIGVTDNGENGRDDIILLLEKGSPLVRSWLRLYAWNLTNGNRGSIEQARVELTIADAWSIGIPLYETIWYGHDEPAGPITEEDIILLKSRSSEPLLIIPSPYNGEPTIRVGFTRKSKIREDIRNESIIVDSPGSENVDRVKISDLKDW